MPPRRFIPDAMFTRLIGESLSRNPRRKLLTAAALVAGMAVATATLTIALEVGDRLAHEFRSFGANLLVTPQSDTLPVEIGGVDYRPVDEGAYLNEADLGKLKPIFWRHNIEGFTPFLDVPAFVPEAGGVATVVGTWYQHDVPVPDGTTFKTGVSITHPSWKMDGRWFHDSADECVVGSALAAKFPTEIKIGACPDPADYWNCLNGRCRRSHRARALVDRAKSFPSPRPVPFAVRKRADQTSRRACRTRRDGFERPEHPVDADRIRSLVLLALHFIHQLPDQDRVARYRCANDSPGRRNGRSRTFARRHAAVDRHSRRADCRSTRCRSHQRDHRARAAV